MFSALFRSKTALMYSPLLTEINQRKQSILVFPCKAKDPNEKLRFKLQTNQKWLCEKMAYHLFGFVINNPSKDNFLKLSFFF